MSDSKQSSGHIEVDGSNLYYELQGQGEPVLLIHAGVTDSRMWNYQMKDLSRNFQVLRFDQRGFGKSDKPEKNYNALKDIIALMDSCGIEKAHVAGISLGALQAIGLAVDYPERVKSLIISGTGFPDMQPAQEVLDKQMEFTNYVAKNGPDSAVNRMLTDPFWSKSLPGNEYPEARALFEEVLKENKNSFMVNWQLRELPMGMMNKLEQISCPVLMFKSENDMPSIISLADTIENKVANLRVKEISDAGHLVNMEKPEEFNRAMIEFIQRNR